MTPNDVASELNHLLEGADEEMKERIGDGQGLPNGAREAMVGTWEAICRFHTIGAGETPLSPESIYNIEDTLWFIGTALAAAKAKHPAPLKTVPPTSSDEDGGKP